MSRALGPREGDGLWFWPWFRPDPFAVSPGGARCLWPGHGAGTARALLILTVLRRGLCREMFQPTLPATGHLRPSRAAADRHAEGRPGCQARCAGRAARPGVQCSSQPPASSPPRKPAGQTAPGLHPGKRSPSGAEPGPLVFAHLWARGRRRPGKTPIVAERRVGCQHWGCSAGRGRALAPRPRPKPQRLMGGWQTLAKEQVPPMAPSRLRGEAAENRDLAPNRGL